MLVHLFIVHFFLGINTLYDLVAQDEIKYGTVDGTSATVILAKMNSEPYTTLYTHMMEDLVPNASVGVEKVRNSYGMSSGRLNPTAIIPVGTTWFLMFYWGSEGQCLLMARVPVDIHEISMNILSCAIFDPQPPTMICMICQLAHHNNILRERPQRDPRGIQEEIEKKKFPSPGASPGKKN